MPSAPNLATNILLRSEETGGHVSVTEIVVPPHDAGPPGYEPLKIEQFADGMAEAADAVGGLKQQPQGGDIAVLGSGKRLFGDADGPTKLSLAASEPTSTAAVMLTYRRGPGAADR